MKSNHTSPLEVYFVGFGSQGRAWANCLKHSGWNVRIFLHQKGKSFEEAQRLGFEPQLLENLPQTLQSLSPQTHPILIALLCPDSLIGEIYQTILSPLSQLPLSLILAHGYASYSGDLKPQNPLHSVCLLAPKAIGPKLEAAFFNAQSLQPQKVSPSPTHDLVAGFYAPEDRKGQIQQLAKAMGFSENHLVSTTLEQEAIGDLISEQGLLCGGMFTLLEWTMEAMAKAGIPDALIREECLRELELISGLMREKGPATTFHKISQAAQCGTLEMRKRFLNSSLPQEFQKQVEEVLNKNFVKKFKSNEWKKEASDFYATLKKWEDRL